MNRFQQNSKDFKIKKINSRNETKLLLSQSRAGRELMTGVEQVCDTNAECNIDVSE